jgi:hypothetical protein
MLTSEDLQAIGQLIEEKSTQPLKKDIEELEGRMNVKFDAVQEQLDGIENRMITLSSLERWETGLTVRLDKRYARL